MSEHAPREILWYRITPRTPLLLGDRSAAGNFLATNAHIPGSVLRGAAAERLLAADRASFEALFDEADEPYFGAGYFGPIAPTWPFPLTARTCKRYPGLPERDRDPKHHGVVDVLAADFAYDLVTDAQFPQRAALQPDAAPWYPPAAVPNVRDRYDRCTTCDRPREPVKDTAAYAMDQRPLRADSAPRRRTTHVGINRARSVAQDELLFSQERLLAHGTGHAFYATVSVPSAKIALLDQALQGDHFIGRGRSRGNGHVTITRQRNVTLPSLDDRLFDFSLALASALQPYARQLDGIRATVPGTAFSVTLRSPALLHDAGRPLRVLPASWLNLSGTVHLIRAWARTTHVGGWHHAAGLPRRTALAVQTGSVYLYWTAADATDLLTALAQLEAHGVGADRERGFGQLTVCAPWHYQNMGETG